MKALQSKIFKTALMGLFIMAVSAANAGVSLGTSTVQVPVEYDNVKASEVMNGRLTSSIIKVGDVQYQNPVVDATGQASSSSTSTTQVNKVATVGGRCSRGQLSTDPTGKLLSCEKTYWVDAAGAGLKGGGLSELLKAFEGQALTCRVSANSGSVVSGRVLNGKAQVRAYYTYLGRVTEDTGWVDGLTTRLAFSSHSVTINLTGVTGSCDWCGVDNWGDSTNSTCSENWKLY